MRPVVPGYRVGPVIGRGGRGEVWAGRPVDRPDATVAIKVCPPDADGADHRRAAAVRCRVARLAQVADPALWPVTEVISGPDGLVLVSPFAAGGTLGDVLAERGSIGAGELAGVLVPIARALAALHAAGLAHGDVKPANVLLAADGSPALTDLVDGAVGGAVCTPAYADPAVALGTADAAGDTYALAVLAYECLAGVLPHTGSADHTIAAARAGAHRPLTAWRSVPRGVAEAIEAGLLPDRADRRLGPLDLAGAVRAGLDGRAIEPLAPARHVGVPTMDPHPTVSVADDLPAEPTAVPVRSRHRRTVRALAVSALTVLIGIVAVAAAGAASPPSHSHSHSPAAASHPDPPGRRCPAVVARNPRSASHPAEVDVDVDVDGDGCSERATWDGRVLQVDRRDTVLRFAVGRPRAQLLAGDWDGDGSRSVALYDPERGEVLYVDHFPAKVGDAVRAGRVEHAARHGRARVTGAAGGRQRVVVSLR